MKNNKPLGQEVHFKKRLKTFKPLGSANGDGAGEGKKLAVKAKLASAEAASFWKNFEIWAS